MSGNICIYHGNCADGFGAAWTVRKAYKEMKTDISFHPGIYGQSAPDVTDLDVLMVDFSYKRNVLLEMADRAKSITILDHHKSAEEDLSNLPSNVKTLFDMNRSGAMISWDYFFEGKAPPRLIEHIQDRDLWRFKLAGTKEIQMALFSYEYDFDLWDKIMDKNADDLLSDGLALERKHMKDIREFLSVATRKLMIGGYVVPAANLPYFYGSEAGSIMAQDAPFAATYYDKGNTRVFGLRSRSKEAGGVDVSKIASLFGGGGHYSASGFEVSMEIAKGFEIS